MTLTNKQVNFGITVLWNYEITEKMTKEEKIAIKMLETSTKIETHCEIGRLWKQNNPILNYNKGMVTHGLTKGNLQRSTN